jgi:iron complex transport system substrate-binding protein
MTHPARLLLTGLAGTLLASAAPPPPPGAGKPAMPRRIVSVNLCADQLVLALADRAQIAGLSRNAIDPTMSAAAKRARGLPVLRDSAETLLVAHPDMIVAAPYQRASVRAPSARFVDAPDANSYPEIVAQLRRIGAAVGRPDRAAALVDRMEARLAAVHRTGRGRVAAYYQRRGYLTGAGTLVDDLMGRLGLVNLATKLGRPVLAQLSIEELVAARPDYLILESDSAAVTDQGSEMLHHPALRGIPRLWVPQAWTVCGTPEYVLAAESLTRQIVALDRIGARR